MITRVVEGATPPPPFVNPSAAFPFEDSQEYAIKIVVTTTPQIEVSVDGVPVLTDTTLLSLGSYPYLTGQIGFNMDDGEATFDNVVIRQLQSGSTIPWSALIVDAGGVGSPILKVDSSNNPHVVYQDRGWVMYSLKTASGWTIEPAVKGRVGVGMLFSLDPSNNPCIIYYQTSTGKLSYATKVGGVWTTQLITQHSAGVPPTTASMVFDDDGTLHLCYFNRDIRSIMYTTRNPTTKLWSAPMNVVTYSGFLMTTSVWPSIALDTSGNPCMSYLHLVNNGVSEIRFLSFDGTSWSLPETVQSTTSASQQFLTVDSNNVPRVIYLGRQCFELPKQRFCDGSYLVTTSNQPRVLCRTIIWLCGLKFRRYRREFDLPN